MDSAPHDVAPHHAQRQSTNKNALVQFPADEFSPNAANLSFADADGI
jgi:hypothetical protein